MLLNIQRIWIVKAETIVQRFWRRFHSISDKVKESQQIDGIFGELGQHPVSSSDSMIVHANVERLGVCHQAHPQLFPQRCRLYEEHWFQWWACAQVQTWLCKGCMLMNGYSLLCPLRKVGETWITSVQFETLTNGASIHCWWWRCTAVKRSKQLYCRVWPSSTLPGDDRSVSWPRFILVGLRSSTLMPITSPSEAYFAFQQTLV